MRKHTDKELLEELIRVRDLLGESPKQTDITKHGKYSVNSYKRAFGGLSKALIKIGEKPNIKLDSTNYDINKEIIFVYKKLNRAPSIDEFNKLSNTSYTAIRRATDDKPWHTLLLESGIPVDYMAGKMKRKISDDEFKNEILRLKSKIGRYPNYYEMYRNGIYSCDAYTRRFGSYIKAMHALGFTDYENQSIYYGQTKTKGKDGIKYKSKFEAEIANYLFNKKQSKIIFDYCYEKRVCSDRTWTCDFVVTMLDNSLMWIEADGMGKNRKIPYGPGNEKIDYYIENNFRFYVVKYRKKIKKQLDRIFV